MVWAENIEVAGSSPKGGISAQMCEREIIIIIMRKCAKGGITYSHISAKQIHMWGSNPQPRHLRPIPLRALQKWSVGVDNPDEPGDQAGPETLRGHYTNRPTKEKKAGYKDICRARYKITIR